MSNFKEASILSLMHKFLNMYPKCIVHDHTHAHQLTSYKIFPLLIEKTRRILKARSDIGCFGHILIPVY